MSGITIQADKAPVHSLILSISLTIRIFRLIGKDRPPRGYRGRVTGLVSKEMLVELGQVVVRFVFLDKGLLGFPDLFKVRIFGCFLVDDLHAQLAGLFLLRLG